jgi:hypothetical protein
MGEHREHHRHHEHGGCDESQPGGHGEHDRFPHWEEPCFCGHGGHHMRPGPGEGRCGCGEGGHGPTFRRRFQTREEKIARLEAYLKDLLAEAKAVEERLAELRG